MSTQSTPEEFLREFNVAMCDVGFMSEKEYEKLIQGWTKLLKLREDAATHSFARELWDIRFCNTPETCSRHQSHDLDVVLAEFLLLPQ